MKQTPMWRWAPAAVLLAIGGAAARAQEFSIQSFETDNARIVFDAVDGATNYAVRTAPTPTGTWSVAMATIPPSAANAVTVTLSIATLNATNFIILDSYPFLLRIFLWQIKV
ncbi:MAG: hypothetical protein PHO37_05765 [Kiritimatiellae bacterium]|nr:hypothetical protein [Kiritimatiellia bacterium]